MRQYNIPDMDFNISVSLFPIISEKSAMDALLADANERTPSEWCDNLARHDLHESYVVVELFHQKRLSLANGQHEFVVFRVESRRHVGPARPHHDIKISRTINPVSIPAKLALWGPAVDTVAVMYDEPINNNERVFHRTWHVDQAPSLRIASQIILHIHLGVPRYTLFYTPCYTFARAITDALCLFTNGINDPQPHRCFFKRSYFLGMIPVGTSKSKEVAEAVTQQIQRQFDLWRLQPQTEAELHRTQDELHRTQAQLRQVQLQLEETRAQLRQELEETRAQLQLQLEETQAQLRQALALPPQPPL